jgi:TPR repeat protein
MRIGFYVCLSWILFWTAGRSDAQALMELRLMASQGDTLARLKMAECFALGLDCKPSQDSVLFYLRPLLKVKHPEASFLVGNSMVRGVGMSKNIPEGLKYLEWSAQAGMVQAVRVLLEIYSGKDAQGPFADPQLIARKNDVAWFKTASNASGLNDPLISFYLGICYLEGKGTAKNDSLALKWLEHSAGWEYCEAQLVLGDVWFFGRTGKGTDLLRARQYYELARYNAKCSIERKGDGMEGEMWVNRLFNQLWNNIWFTTAYFHDWRIMLPVPEVKPKDYQKKRY